jgi:hypothetical protein
MGRDPAGHSFRRGVGLALLIGLVLAAAARADDPEKCPDAPPAEPVFPCGSGGGVDWTKVPPIRPAPRLGYFIVWPTGPGYYSLLDQLRGNYREKAPNLPFGLFGFTPWSWFDVDFRYLDKPDNTQHDYLDCLKRIHLGDDWLLSFGGQTWVRMMREVDSRLTTFNNNYELFRTRFDVDLWYRDVFRVYAEYIYADAFNFDLEPLPIDINRSDLLNLFADLKLAQLDGPVYLRVGRQEMLYGSQRLISPLEWANTRRTFQGVKGFYLGKDWDFDLFWVQPVVPNRNAFDSVDNNRNFFGAWATRKFRPGNALDLYYLYLDNTNPTAVGENGVAAGQYIHTLGTRCFGDRDNLLYDVELMLQLGTFSNQDKVAGNTTYGLGYFFKDVSWKPQFWVYYDWASGDSTPGRGPINTTFNQLFPFGHYYFGYLDLVGRQNIRDVSAQLVFFPENYLTALVQFHNFWLDSSRDALYSAAGVPLRVDPTGRAGHFVGQELDLVLSVQLATHSNLLLGWSKLFAGEFIKRSGPDVSPELFYLQYNYRW